MGTDSEATDLAGWRARVRQELDGADPFEALRVTPLGGPALRPLYTPGPPTPRVGARTADVRQQVVYSDPDVDVVAGWLREDAAAGVVAFELQLDRAARRGIDDRDADEFDAHGAVDGLAVATSRELAGAFDGVLRPGSVLAVGVGGNALPGAALVLAALRLLRIDPADLQIDFLADPLGALVADGALPRPHATLGWEAAQLARYCDEALPSARALRVDAGVHARAGAGPALQLATALATGLEYLRYLNAAGVPPEVGARQVAFGFETDRHFLVELAKLRAVRVLWRKALAAAGVAATPAVVRAATGRRTLTEAAPWVNPLRATQQAAAAILGGADMLTVVPHEQPLGRPSDRSRRLARNTVAVLLEEARLGDVVDPGAGGAAMETLTDDLAREAWQIARSLDAQGLAGGLLLEELSDPGKPAGGLRERIGRDSIRRAQRLQAREEQVLGVTAYEGRDDMVRAQPIDLDDVRRAAVARRTGQVRPDAELAVVTATCAATSSASGPAELVEACVVAALAGASVAELGRALSTESGERVQPWAQHTDEQLANPEGAS